MQKGNTYTLVFAAVICVVCSILLASASALLRDRQTAMAELDRKTNVLKAFGVATRTPEGQKISEKDVNQTFTDHITEIFLDAATGQPVTGGDNREGQLPLYLWKDGDAITKYAFPVSGKGLWSTIYGYLALGKDLQTIIGITFYRHGETPGLGGEIEKDWFQDQFKGKRIFEDQHLLRLEVVKGKVADKYPQGNDHAVDGISGATLTGNGLNHFLNEDLEKYEQYFKSIRKG